MYYIQCLGNGGCNMGQLIVRLNTALTSGSWTDEYGNVWAVRNTLKAAEDPDGGNNAIQFSRDAAQISTTAPSSMKNEWTFTCWVKEPINCLFSSSGNIYFSVQFWNALNGDGGSTYLDSKIVDFNDSFTHLKLHEMQEDEYDYKNGWFFFEICRDKYN